jgi:hypothetical protein
LIDTRIGEIRLDQDRAGDRINRQQVHADHRRRPLFQRHLHPAARRTAQVDDPAARPDQAQLLVHLDQLEGRARAPALGPRLLGPFVGQLALDPLLARQAFLVGRLDLLAHAAPGRRPARRRLDHAPAFLIVAHGDGHRRGEGARGYRRPSKANAHFEAKGHAGGSVCPLIRSSCTWCSPAFAL